MKYRLILIIILIFVSSCNSINNKAVITNNNNNKVTISLEVAKTPEEKQKGLMFREYLSKDSGMLFIFENEGYNNLWMKNTLIPLDIIFIDTNFTIVDIIQAYPCTGDPCTIYSPKSKAKFVIEANLNFTQEHNIQPGNSLKLFIKT